MEKLNTENNNPSILFLHGYNQNAHIFNTRLKNIQKNLNKKFNNKLNYIFVDAPFELKEQSIENEIQKGWMFFDKLDNFYELNSIKYKGLEESIDFIFKQGDLNKNIQCIFSFSQGSVLLIFIIILSLYNENKYEIKKHFPNLKCLIIVSGFYRPIPENEEFKQIIEVFNKNEEIKKIDIPLMNVFGKNDQFVDNNKSKEISKFFEVYEEFNHDGKHYVPSSKKDIIKFENFLEKYLNL